MLQTTRVHEYYRKQSKFLVAVDCIIFGLHDTELKLLLLRRKFNPAKGKWSLMGGFLKDEETTEQAAARVLYNLTGLDNVYMDQVGSFSQPDRDPGARVISIAYYALINIEDYDPERLLKYNAHWIGIHEVPELIFDHENMVHEGLKKLRRKALTQPVGFNLLPEKFTMPQLQCLYETIFDKDLDKRNFRKKILSMGFFEKLDEKDKSNSKRGAFYYRIDREKLTQLNNEEISF